jgi:ABC-type antimicrobial peptide transport system permease subunit
MAFLLRTAGDPTDVIPRIRTAMAELDPDVALDRLETLEAGHRRDLAGVRFLTTLFGAFGVLALVLAISGVYGLVSFSVSQRSQEIGIRMAVGATTGHISRHVLREGLWLAGFGAALGLGLAFGFGRLLGSALFGLVDLNPLTLAAAVGLLLGAAIGASWFPSLRATRVDPVFALRSE